MNGARVAFAFLTRLPVGDPGAVVHGSLARSAAYFPIVGLIVGVIGGTVLWTAIAVGLPGGLSAGLALGTTVLLTGALHEDGLADTADGLGLAREPARALEIMHDSRIGTFGVLALIFSIGLRWSAVAVLASRSPILGAVALTSCAAMSRAYLPVIMATLPTVRPDGLARSAGRPSAKSVIVGLAFGFAVNGVLVMLSPLIVMVASIVVSAVLVFLFASFVRSRLGGHTGDILGAAQQVGEISVLLTIAAMLGVGE